MTLKAIVSVELPSGSSSQGSQIRVDGSRALYLSSDASSKEASEFIFDGVVVQGGKDKDKELLDKVSSIHSPLIIIR